VSAVSASSAASGSVMDPVRALQHTLYRAAKADPGRRFHALGDKVYRRDVLERAWEDVRRNGGAAGIDRVTITDVQEYGVPRLACETGSARRASRGRGGSIAGPVTTGVTKPQVRPAPQEQHALRVRGEMLCRTSASLMPVTWGSRGVAGSHPVIPNRRPSQPSQMRAKAGLRRQVVISDSTKPSPSASASSQPPRV